MMFIRLMYIYGPQRSCGKVMFSQACVKNSAHRGEVSAAVHAGIHTPVARYPLARHPLVRHPPADTPLPAATAADGTHPNGMHSC